MQREYPNHPRVAVGVVVVRDSHVLLVKRGQEPGKGLWSVPGGLIELGETTHEAAQREVKEETGIEIRVGKLLEVANKIVRDDEGRTRFHYVLVDYAAEPLTMSLKPESDASEAKWVDFKDLRNYSMTRGALRLMERVDELKAHQQSSEPPKATKSTRSRKLHNTKQEIKEKRKR